MKAKLVDGRLEVSGLKQGEPPKSELTDSRYEAEGWLQEAQRQYDERRWNAARAAAAIARAWAVVGATVDRAVDEP